MVTVTVTRLKTQVPVNTLDVFLQVQVVADACSSRTQTDRHLALSTMRHQLGAYLTTAESVALGLVADAGHPKFKKVQEVIKPLVGDTMLLRPSL